MTKILGIDDAGRGPVIGPMILAGVITQKKDLKKIEELGAKDSKLLLPKKRNQIKEVLIKEFKTHLEITSPEEIDNSTNLNYLEAIKAAMIINKLTENEIEKVEAIIDCPSVNIESWCSDVKNLLKNPEKIILKCEHKADLNHLIVSAASIIAKEKREEEIKNLKDQLKIDFGSGYPSDPTTKEFIRKFHDKEEYSKIIRHSWNTVKKLKKDNSQKKLF